MICNKSLGSFTMEFPTTANKIIDGIFPNEEAIVYCKNETLLNEE